MPGSRPVGTARWTTWRGTAHGATVTGKLQGNELELAFADGGSLTGTVHADRIHATLARAGTTTEYVATRD